PDNIYIPSAPSTVGQIVNSASEIMDRLHRLDVEGVVNNLNKLLTTANDRIAALDTKSLQQRTERTLAKIESTLNDVAAKKLSNEAVALLADLRKTNTELQATLSNPTFKNLPDTADAALQRVRDLVAD